MDRTEFEEHNINSIEEDIVDERMIEHESSVLMKGATILAVAGVISKLFGGIFRIPLTNMIGMEGQSYYGAAYPVYQLLFSIATAGFPVAISKMVAERIAHNDYINAQRSYKLALKVSTVLGIVSFLIMFLGAGAISRFYNNPGAEASMRAISFALLFTPILASLRGYYQGRQEMIPTAATEVVEQLARVAVGLTLAYSFYKVSLVNAAAGATFGASAGVIVALLIMIILYKKDAPKRKEMFKASIIKKESDKSRFKELLYYVVPITIGSSIMPIMFNIDAAVVIRRLVATGWDHATARNLYGLMSGYCDPIVGLPFVFVDAICISMMPAIAAAYALKHKNSMDNHIKTGLKTMMIITYPCTIGLIVLARPILQMIFFKRLDEAALAAPTLRILSVSIIMLAIMRGFSTSLQGIGKMMTPVANLLIGVVAKAVISYILIGIPAININGAAASSVIAYLIAGFLNYRALKREVDVNLDFASIFGTPLIAALIMGASAFTVYKLMFMVVGSNAVSCMIAIPIAAFVYFAASFKTGAVTQHEIELLPKGELLYKLAKKLKLVG